MENEEYKSVKTPDLSTINGWGTKFIGQYDCFPDGSYITILWFVGFWIIPIIPLSAYRVKDGLIVHGNDGLLKINDDEQYIIYSKEKLNKKLIIKSGCLIWLCVPILLIIAFYCAGLLYQHGYL
jgi:hypothetical protein